MFIVINVEWSPSKLSVRILGDGNSPHSTAIIVGPRCVIACAHSLNKLDNPAYKPRSKKAKTHKLVGEDYWIVKSISRNTKGEFTSADPKIHLKLFKFHQWNDWAVFERVNGRFSPEEIAVIQSNNEEANFIDDLPAQVIHCPVAFSLGLQSSRPNEILSAWRSDISIQSQTPNHVRYGGSTNDLSCGSSGGAVFVKPSMEVVAMHQEKFSEIEGNNDDVDFVLESEKRADSEEKAEEEYESVAVAQKADSETVKSLTGGNAGQGSAIILARCKRLIAYVDELNKSV